MSPRTGRPTDNPKPYLTSIRLDQECKSILDSYCNQKKVTLNEAVRRGIKRLEKDIKK